jgi:hypothetical protein
MSQSELVCTGKFTIALLGYFIGTGLVGALLSGDSGPETISPVAWVVGGIVFAVLATCV